MLPPPTKLKLQQLQSTLFVRTCPESLRLDVVEEFVETQGRLPRPDAEGEEFPSAYVESALGRRHVSTASGEQLTGQQFGRWCAFFSRMPGVQPVWGEDLAKHVLSEFYHTHTRASGCDRPNAPPTVMVFSCIWWYLVVSGCIWLYLVVFGGIWWYLVVPGGFWWYLVVFCGIW